MKINLSEFYDIYAISLIANTYHDKSELLVYLLPIAEKYISITTKACQEEMNHLFDSYTFEPSVDKQTIKKYYKQNKDLLNQKKFNPKKLSLKSLSELFFAGNWDIGYGGEAWGKIAEECINLKKATKQNNLLKIIFYLDRLNQLEHNNDLYLSDFTTFNLKDHLDCKFKCHDEFILNTSSKEIKKLYTKHTKGL